MNPTATPVASLAPTASLHRFDAYRLALAFRAHVVGWLPLKRAELSDQLDRASISAVLNVAEGAGRVGRDQARNYAMSRGSAFECLAVLDLLDLEMTPIGSAQARATLVRLIAVLTALVRRRSYTFVAVRTLIVGFDSAWTSHKSGAIVGALDHVAHGVRSPRRGSKHVEAPARSSWSRSDAQAPRVNSGTRAANSAQRRSNGGARDRARAARLATSTSLRRECWARRLRLRVRDSLRSSHSKGTAQSPSSTGRTAIRFRVRSF